MEYFWKIITSDEVQKIILNLIVLPLISFFGLKLSVFINEKIKNEKAREAVSQLYQKVCAKVLDIYKSGSEDLKKKANDGNFTAEEKAEWKNNIISHVKLTAQSELNQLKLIGKDAEDIIKLHAETAWSDIKKKLL
jgi:hypothetical protein